MTADVLDKNGTKTGTITLPKEVFGVRWNADAVHQTLVAYEANKRKPLAHTKNRGEVAGTGKKPWRQKGTGRARHGSRRSPIWVGGGVTFGPRNDKIFAKKVNRKMKQFALASLLSKKLVDKDVFIFDSLQFEKLKTKDAAAFLKKVFPGRKSLLFIRAKGNTSLTRVARNIPKTGVSSSASLNAYALAQFEKVAFEKDAIPELARTAQEKSE